jgi:hypothetical protein
MGRWGDPDGSSRGRAVLEVARIAAVVTAALAGGAGILLLITQVVAPAQPRLAVRGHRTASALTSPSPATLPALPEPPAPVALPPPPTDSGVPDVYLADLTGDPGANDGEIVGPGYRFARGLGMALSSITREEFVVPTTYQSMTATLKGLAGTIRFTVLVGGRTVLDRTLSPYQPPVTVTCATPEGSAVVIAAVFEGGGSLSEAFAIWGNARFSTSPAPADGCS